MLNEINRGEVRTRLLRWISSIWERGNGKPESVTSKVR
jgi:hypothetical protein